MLSPQVYFFQMGERLTEDPNGPDLRCSGGSIPMSSKLSCFLGILSPSLVFWGGFNSLLAPTISSHHFSFTVMATFFKAQKSLLSLPHSHQSPLIKLF